MCFGSRVQDPTLGKEFIMTTAKQKGRLEALGFYFHPPPEKKRESLLSRLEPKSWKPRRLKPVSLHDEPSTAEQDFAVRLYSGNIFYEELVLRILLEWATRIIVVFDHCTTSPMPEGDFALCRIDSVRTLLLKCSEIAEKYGIHLDLPAQLIMTKCDELLSFEEVQLWSPVYLTEAPIQTSALNGFGIQRFYDSLIRPSADSMLFTDLVANLKPRDERVPEDRFECRPTGSAE